MTDEEMIVLWTGAAGYYLGRSGFVVEDFCVMLIEAWPQLPARAQKYIVSDVEAAFRRDDEARTQGVTGLYLPLGMDQYRAAWQRVRALWRAPAAFPSPEGS